MSDELIAQLKLHEGLRLTVYKDTVGIPTIGYGHNLEAHQQNFQTCTEAQADEWLKVDAARACEFIENSLPWSSTLDPARLGVLQNMAFNMGFKLLGFRRTLALIRSGAYQAASIEMLNSAWAREVGARADSLSRQMEFGIWQLGEHHANAASV